MSRARSTREGPCGSPTAEVGRLPGAALLEQALRGRSLRGAPLALGPAGPAAVAGPIHKRACARARRTSGPQPGEAALDAPRASTTLAARARSAATLALLFTCAGCFDFDGRVAACRGDGGAWLCALDAAAPAGPPRAALCAQGWCWENPSPVGVDLTAVAALSRQEVWVGGKAGWLLRWDGGSWEGEALGPDVEVTGLCQRGGTLFAASTRSVGSPTLFRFDGARWAPTNVLGNIAQARCTDAGLLLLQGEAVSRYDVEAQARTPVATVPQGCVGLLERGEGCVVACAQAGRVKLFDCQGALEADVPGAAASQLWRDPQGFPTLAVRGAGSTVYTSRDAGLWEAVARSPLALFAGSGGAVVGADDTVLWLGGDAGQVPLPASSQPHTLLAVSVDSSGGVWAVGEGGVVHALRAGSWSTVGGARADRDLEGLQLTPRPLAFGAARTLLVRSAAGWSPLQPPEPGAEAWRGAYELAGGLLLFSDRALRLPELSPQEPPDGGVDLVVLNPRLAAFSTFAGIFELDLAAGRVGQVVAGPSGRLSADSAAGAFAAASSAGVWYSTRSASGAWSLLSGGPANARDVALAAGALWAASDLGVARWNGASWESATLPPLELLAALGDGSAIAFSADGRAAFRVTSGPAGLRATSFPVPGVRLRRLRAAADALWGVGDFGAIVRFALVDGGAP